MKIAMMLCLLVLTAESSWAAFDDYQRFRKGMYEFEFETQYFKTDANYTDSGGSYQKLPYGQSYEIFNFYLKSSYDFSKNSSFYGSLNMANATSTGVTMTRSNSSVTGAYLGYAYRPYNETFDLITDFNVLIPFQKIDQNTDTVINSEGVIEATGLLRAQKDFTTFSALGYLGATYRQARSSLVPWGIGIEANYAKWAWGGKVFGYQSVTDDPDTASANKLQRTIVTDRVNASSLYFYSVNPSVADTEAWVRFKFDNVWAVTVGGGMTVTGANTAAGYHAGVALKYSWDSEPSYYTKPGISTQEDGLSSERKVPKFKEETEDGVNQKLFQKKGITPGAPAPRPGGDISPAPDNVAMKKTGPQQTPSQIEANDGGEVQLKLKRKRKKKPTS